MKDLAVSEVELVGDGRGEEDVEGVALGALGCARFGGEQSGMEGAGFVRDADFAGELGERREGRESMSEKN